jgi:hypothetical protein
MAGQQRTAGAFGGRVDRGLAHARSTVSDWKQLTRDDFPLDCMAKRLVEIDRELREGKGLLVIRGIDIRRYSASDTFLLWMGISSWLGVLVPQNKQGELIGAVTDGGIVKADEQGRMVPASSSARCMSRLHWSCELKFSNTK